MIQQKIENLDNTEPSVRFLNKVHKNIYTKAKINKDDIVAAKKLQQFLRSVKYVIKSDLGFESIFSAKDFPLSKIREKKEFLSLCLALKEINSKIFTEKNLINIPETSFGLGNELETGIARIMKGLQFHFSEKENTHGVGNQQIMPLIEDGMREYFIDVYKEASEELNKFKGEEKIAKTFSSVSGKIDAIGLYGELTISATTELEESLVEALKNSTFTLKNYISIDHLKFGQTNPFRVFLSVIPQDVKNPIGQYYRIKGCIQNHYSKHSNAPKLFYRIRAIYELTGIGENYIKTEKNEAFYDVLTQSFGAKYLIWNNPLEDIYVIPTGRIVKNIIENESYIANLPKDWREVMYGPITIKQVDLKKLT